MCGVADMKLLRLKVHLSVNVLNLRRPLSVVIRSTSLFGVGGSGRSPVSTNRGKAGFCKRAMSFAAIAWLSSFQSSVRSGVVAQLLGRLKLNPSAKPLATERIVIANCS